MNTEATGVLPLASDQFFPPLKDYIIAQTGLVYYVDRESELVRSIARRLQALGLDGCLAYLALLESGEPGRQELDLLIETLTIGETYFFRHGELFHALEHTVLPDLIARNAPHRRLRIWSAGCSIGAEAYSISILLRRHLAARVRDWDITILGTDINRDFLARAAAGRFEAWALRGMPDDERRACFVEHGDQWTIHPYFKHGVSFQYHNLATHPFPSLLQNLAAFDLILCRNVMIYFEPRVIRGLVDRFYQSLVEGGWLLVGHAEHNAQWFTRFHTLMSHGAVLYQKGAWHASPAPPVSQIADASTPSTLAAPPDATYDRTPRDAQRHLGTRGGQRRIGPRSSRRPALGTAGRGPAGPAVDERAGNAQAAMTGELEQIRSLADRGALDEAQRRCQRLVKSHKLDPTSHFYHALIAEQLGQHDVAQHSLTRAIYLDGNCVLAHYYRGLLFQKQNVPARAARAFQNVLRLLVFHDPAERVPHADDLTVEQLQKLTRAHLTALEQA